MGRPLKSNNKTPPWPKRWKYTALELLTLSLLTGALPCAFAAEQTDNQSAAQPSAEASEPPADADDVVQSTSRTVRSTVEWLARGIDSNFGDKPFSDGGKVSNGKVGLSLLKRQDNASKFNLTFNARFRLPNLERYQYFFVGNDDQQGVVTDQPESFSRQELLRKRSQADNSFFVGLGLLLFDAVDMRLGIHGGLKPYAQARYRKPWQLGPADLIEVRETVFFTFNDRVGSTTAASYEHAFTSTFAARWLNAATITQNNPRLNWSSSLGAYQSFGDQRVLSLEALLSGTKGDAVRVTEYGLQTKWTQPVYKDTLLGEVILGHFWPRPDAQSPRGSVWAIGGVITLKF